MFLDENVVITFRISTWNALFKNGILLKYTPFFKTKFEGDVFNQTAQHQNFVTFNSPLMLQKSLDYVINQFQRFYRVPENIVSFKKIKNYKI